MRHFTQIKCQKPARLTLEKSAPIYSKYPDAGRDLQPQPGRLKITTLYKTSVTRLQIPSRFGFVPDCSLEQQFILISKF